MVQFKLLRKLVAYYHASLSFSLTLSSRRYTSGFFCTESIGITAVRTLPNVFHDGHCRRIFLLSIDLCLSLDFALVYG